MSKMVINIDREKCIGCGKCVSACHNSALELVDGKAELVREPMCDGLGACIGECPAGALKIEKKQEKKQNTNRPFVCPSMAVKPKADKNTSGLNNWPIQLRLINPANPEFKDMPLAIAADCAGFAMAGANRQLIQGSEIIIACPKLEDLSDQTEKLAELFRTNPPAGIDVIRMEVPCCAGLMRLVYQSLVESEKKIPLYETVISIDGNTISKKKVDDTLILYPSG